MIYISLTTVPKRLKYWEIFSRNLESLVNQNTDREYYVILNIPEYYVLDDHTEYIMPDGLIDFAKKHPKLIINRNIYDYGPIIKIYGALDFAKNPDDIIIALDDDQIYHPDMIEYHIKKLNEHPEHAICFTSDRALEKRTFIDVDGIKKFKFYGSTVYFPLQQDTYVASPCHVLSVSYKRYYFKDDFNEELFALADGDDPLMGYYLKKHQIWPLCVMWDKQEDFRPIRDEGSPNPFWHFPSIMPLGYPEETAGYLIRQKHPQTIHGYQSNELMNFLYDNKFVYIEKNQ